MKMRTRGWTWRSAGARRALTGSAILALAACSGVRDEQQSGQAPTGQQLAQATPPASPPSSTVSTTPSTPTPTSTSSSTPTPSAASLAAALQFEWTGSEVLPEYKQVMMTPVVVDVNGDRIPDIVFSTFDGDYYNETNNNGGNGNTNGVLRAISGKDGRELWTVVDPYARVKPAASIAAGDIDADGKVEICGIPENGRGIICFEHDGSFKFRSAEDAYDYNEWGGPSLADLDGDGTVEILDGNRVYSHTGALKWVGADGMGGAQYTGPVSFAADIDQDGSQEVINGRAVYRADGSLKCANTEIPQGFAGVANFDEDPAAEIAVAGYGTVSLLDDDCTLLWTRSVHYTDPGHPFPTQPGHGGPPNIADFDGDGQVEIGLAGDWNYTVYGADGSVKWTHTIQEYSSGKTTSTTFDFEADGRTEVIYADELYLRVFDGATGAVRWQTRHSSGTTHELPLVVDVDADGSAEIIVVENNHAAPGFNGIRVYGDNAWVGTRGIWNQHAYSITNVNDDGTIPAHPVANWLTPGLNTFRSNAPGVAGVCRVTGSWEKTGSLALGRILHTAEILEDGRVLVAGGFNTTSELYDAATGTWARTGDTLATHIYHSMTRLADGRVLIAGGGTCPVTLATAEVYYPALGRWKATGSLVVFRTHHTATLLPSGKVLITGGEDTSGAALSSVELYDPATGTFSLAGNMGTARRDHTATMLPNGKVLVVGGGSWDIASSTSAELYDPAKGTWSATGSMSTPRRFHSATLLPNGKVLAIAGYHQATGIQKVAEVYNPATGTWCPAGSLEVDRYRHTATLLGDGRVLATAGVSNTDQASVEVFSVGGK
ncbi:kelch repeat-containing protein [Archangium violaceum]|uniref:kelch repeat-containing protein n=1 Tax=Archangium violaceum TaxID=83451 RepID=UPI000B085B58|nr:kelch repeat-containing protein [Archangium violaceum]